MAVAAGDSSQTTPVQITHIRCHVVLFYTNCRRAIVHRRVETGPVDSAAVTPNFPFLSYYYQNPQMTIIAIYVLFVIRQKRNFIVEQYMLLF